MEQWKDIPWYEWLYQCSNKGNVKTLNYRGSWKEKLLKIQQDRWWYLWVHLAKKWERKHKSIHRLVLLTFNWPNKLDCNHIDWNKTNNELENLEYCTKSENTLHCVNVLWRHNTKWKFWKLHHNSKEVKQLDLNWKLIKVWGCARDVHNELWINYRHISAVCLWKRKTSFWYKWEFNN